LGLALDEPKEDDAHFQVDKLNFIVEKHLAKSWPEVHIDYRDSWMGKGFVVYAGSGAGC
jgi:Fe-S cluster assembly iron-binding protein IscA